MELKQPWKDASSEGVTFEQDMCDRTFFGYDAHLADVQSTSLMHQERLDCMFLCVDSAEYAR